VHAVANFTPSSKNIVWAVGAGSILVSWDPDSSRLGQGLRRSAPYHTCHIPYEPLTTPLIRRDEHGVLWPDATQLQPRLAASWSANPEKTVWTCNLRRGVISNYGNELTAEQVKWCWDRVYSLKRVGWWRSDRIAGLASHDNIEVLDRV
jgi:ABC-type transport system substrate-binding protein